MKRLLFHYPGPFHARLDSGEKKRPVMMVRAFERLGYEVLRLVGERPEREQLWPRLEQELAGCTLVYSENSTLPLRLTGPRHLPAWNPVDFRMFRAARRDGVPAGVFYRDVYWRFASFRQEHGWAKSVAATWFYHDELRLFRQTCRRVFVPSYEYGGQLPGIPTAQLMELPPGCEPQPPRPLAPQVGLRLVYVGSARPPIYDLHPLVDAMAAVAELPITLTISTRPDDWAGVRHLYTLPPNVSVVHVEGAQLAALLASAEVMVMCFAPDDYRRIAVPLKLFETIGYGLPVLANTPTAVSRMVAQYGIGWAVDATAFAATLRHLLAHPDEVRARRERSLAIQAEHTWEARARQVIAALTGAPPAVTP